MKKSERKNRSARMRMRQEERACEQKFATLELEHQKWLSAKILMQIVFVIAMCISMWLAGKYFANIGVAASIFLFIIAAYAVLAIVTKWRAIDYWDDDINLIANGRLFAIVSLISAAVVFLR